MWMNKSSRVWVNGLILIDLEIRRKWFPPPPPVSDSAQLAWEDEQFVLIKYDNVLISHSLAFHPFVFDTHIWCERHSSLHSLSINNNVSISLYRSSSRIMFSWNTNTFIPPHFSVIFFVSNNWFLLFNFFFLFVNAIPYIVLWFVFFLSSRIFFFLCSQWAQIAVQLLRTLSLCPIKELFHYQ